MGGLAAAACLAKSGQRTLIVDSLDGPGGVAHAFHRGPYTFDPAVHITVNGFEGDILSLILAALGIGERIEQLHLAPLFAAEIAGERYAVAVGMQEALQSLTERFPARADQISRYFELCAKVTHESMQPPTRVGLSDLATTMAQLPNLFRYRTSTLGEVLEELIDDPEVRSVLGAYWPYLGSAPSRLSFIAAAGVLMAMIETGPMYPRGGFQALADALLEVVLENAGQAMFKSTVTAIVVQDGHVTGVRLDDGEFIAARTVISNADATQTFERLIGEEHLPERFMRRLRRMKPSPSAFVLYSATSLDTSQFGLAHETFLHSHADHDRNYEQISQGGLGGMWLTLPSLHDASLAPAGEQIVICTSLVPYDIGEPWGEARERYTEMMLAAIESLMPGYRERITYLETATPLTFEQLTHSERGAIYGWENVPAQTIGKRLAPVTPIDGLLLAGHWTEPGSGSLRAVFSGVQAAAITMGLPGPVEMLGALS